MRIIFMLRALLLLVSFVIGSSASASSTATADHFKAELWAESLTPAPAKPVTLSLVIRPDAGWHIYYKNPGESGLPPQLEWHLPDGVTAGEIQYPVPSELSISGIDSNVYEGDTALLVDLSIARGFERGGAVPVHLDADVLICTEGFCVPESISLDLSLTIGSGEPVQEAAMLFEQARGAMPVPLNGVTYSTQGDTLMLFLPGDYGRYSQPDHVFFDKDGIVATAISIVTTPDGRHALELPSEKLKPTGNLSGVISVKLSDTSVTGYRFTAHPAVPFVRELVQESSVSALLLILGGAVLGGLLLNLMPCVFPILSIKVLALVRAGGDEREARMEAIAYTLGAVMSLVALGAALIALKSAGHAVGWAFQLQDPRVVAVLLILITAIATNFAGLYELPSLSFNVGRTEGFLPSFGAGALAAFIATPCTGPFMAGALGAALVLPVPGALAVFAGLGFGLALPFLCLAFIAPMRRWLPKPGVWMVTLRRLLSLPMFATAVGLAWIVGREAGVSAMTFAIVAAMLAGISLWWFGLRQMAGRSALPALTPMLIAFVIVSIGLPAGTRAGTDAGSLKTEPFSPSQLADLRADHQPVFLYLTADWCMTCKVNEATSLESASVINAFSEAGVVVLEGDWTRPDKQISQFLADHGRAGIPLYLWYPAIGAPEELPQILTPSMLTDLIR